MITQLHGDNLDLLLTRAPGSVQTVVTSPAYFGLRVYSIPPSAWPEIVYVPMAGLPPVVIPAMLCQLGAESDPLAYIAHLVHVFRLARPVLRDDGTLWVNLADSYAQTGSRNGEGETRALKSERFHGGRAHLAQRRVTGNTGIPDKNLLGIPHRAALALQADGWVWRSEVIWHAPNKMPESVQDRPTRAHEQVLLFGKGPRYYYDSEAVAEEATMRIQRRLTPQETRPNGHAVDGWKEPRILRDEPSADGGGTRNRRSVWDIATAPMPGRLRPPECEECMGTGIDRIALRGAHERRMSNEGWRAWAAQQPECPACEGSGHTDDEAHYAAWPPALVEIMIKASTANKACTACGAAWVRQVERDAGVVNVDEGLRQQNGAAGAQNGGTQKVTLGVTDQVVRRDLGFAPACACDAGIGRCVVLDPFGGTGTTGQVAEQLGRDSILIDLGYQELQQKRTDNLQMTIEAYL